MEVQINNYPVDVEMDEEKILSEVVHSVSEWARERDLIFIEAYINDAIYAADRIPEVPLGEIDKINFILQSRADVCISTLNEGANYCNKVIRFIQNSINGKKPEMSVKESMSSGIDWIIDITRKTLNLLSLDEESVKYRDSDLRLYIENMRGLADWIMKCENSEELMRVLIENVNLFSSFIDIFKMFLQGDSMRSLVIQSIDSPDILMNSLDGIREKLPTEIQNLEDAAVAFQTGRDEDGSARLQDFIAFIYEYIRTCYQVAPVFEIDPAGIEIEGMSLEQKNRNIENLLGRIIEVMENNDIISLSDILEYEMKIELENLNQYIDLMIDNITQRV